MTKDDSGETRTGAEPVEPRARTRLETLDALCERLRGGTPISHACDLEDVAESSFHLWKNTDPEWSRRVRRASAEAAEVARMQLEALISSEAKNANVQLHYMARQWPSAYGETKRVEVTGAEGGPQKHEHSGSISVPLEDLKRIARGAKEST